MKCLLSTAMDRRVQLLNLLSGTNYWMTSNQLARIIHCSTKSVMQDCQYIEDNWSEYLTVETSKKNGIRFVTSSHHSIHSIYRDIIQESTAFKLLELIFLEPEKAATYYQKKLFLSNSSLYRLSNLISRSLNLRKISLERNPYVISSQDERQVRYFFISYFLEVYGIHQWPFSIPKDTVLALAKKVNTEFNLQLNDVQMMHLSFSIVVTIIRERQGFIIKNRKDPINNFEESARIIKTYKNEVANLVKSLDVKLPDNWYQDFCYSIFWWDFGWDNRQERENILLQSSELIETIRKALNISVSDSSHKSLIRFLTYIYAKHKMYPYKKYMVYDRYSYSSKIIKQNFVVFTAVVSKALKTLEKKTKFPWYSMYLDEILHETMIRWDQLTDLLEGLRKQVSVAVMSDLGQEHATLLGNYLQENFKKKVHIHLQESSFYEVKPFDKKNKFDLYVTNYPVNQIPEENLIIVEDIPSFKNLVDLGKYIEHRRLVLPETIPYLNS